MQVSTILLSGIDSDYYIQTEKVIASSINQLPDIVVDDTDFDNSHMSIPCIIDALTIPLKELTQTIKESTLKLQQPSSFHNIEELVNVVSTTPSDPNIPMHKSALNDSVEYANYSLFSDSPSPWAYTPVNLEYNMLRDAETQTDDEPICKNCNNETVKKM